MPIPKPKKGEKEKDFIERCMGAIGGEYDDNKQAVAVCYSTWRDKDKKKPSGNDFAPLVANIDMSHVRDATYRNRPYKVAPVVMAKEGVMNDLLYPAEELSKYVGAWNGRPLTLFHPKDEMGEHISANDSSVPESVHMGMVRNAYYEDGLRAEAWLDVLHAQSTRPEVLDYYGGGKRGLEVSTGLWGDVVQVAGKWQDEDYSGIMTNIRPDHLALLPGGEGACNWGKGCGLRANEEGNEMSSLELRKQIFSLNITDVQLREAIQKALPNSAYVVEIDLSKKEFIYEQFITRSDGTVATDMPVGDYKLYRRGYMIENGDAKLSDDKTEVQRVVSYKAMSKEKGGCVNMDRSEKVQALIADPRTRFESGCEVFLNTLTDEQLDRLQPPDNVAVVVEPPAAPEPPAVNEPEPQPAPAAPEPPKSATEWLAAQEGMPKEIKDTMADALMLNAARRNELVETIVKDPRNTFSNEQLQGKSRQELESIAALIKPIDPPKADPLPAAQFFGMQLAGSAPRNDDKGPEPMVVPSLQEAFARNLKR